MEQKDLKNEEIKNEDADEETQKLLEKTGRMIHTVIPKTTKDMLGTSSNRNTLINSEVVESTKKGKWYAYIDYVFVGDNHVKTKRSDDVDSKVEAEIELIKLKEWFYEIVEEKKNKFRKDLLLWGGIILAIILLGL